MSNDDSRHTPTIVGGEAMLQMIPKEEGKLVTVIETSTTWKCVYLLGELHWQLLAARPQDVETEWKDDDDETLTPQQKAVWERAQQGCRN